jgi:hypothetical protein
MRGRLINPFAAQIHRLNTLATDADPDGAGPLASGYDDVFREPVKLPAAGDEGEGETHRVEMDPILVPCQVEMGSLEKTQMFFSGNSPDDSLVLVFHMQDLETLGLVDPTSKMPKLKASDRLGAIYTLEGVLVQTFQRPLYATGMQPGGFGFGNARNLLFGYFSSRQVA